MKAERERSRTDIDLEQLTAILQRAKDLILAAEDTHACMASVCDPILVEIWEAQSRVAALKLALEVEA